MTTFPGTVAVCILLMAGFCVLGLRLRQKNRERPFRIVLCGLLLGIWAITQGILLLPAYYEGGNSWPLHICNMAALIGPIALLSGNRALNAVLYFWGIGLSTQAFITPVLSPEFGLDSIWYWLFWVNHTIVVGVALYAVVVTRFRPQFGDLLIAIGATCAWVAVMIPLNLHMEWNYGYLGPGKPRATTLIDSLGPWPARLFWMYGITTLGFIILWLPWPLLRRRVHSDRPSTP